MRTDNFCFRTLIASLVVITFHVNFQSLTAAPPDKSSERQNSENTSQNNLVIEAGDHPNDVPIKFQYRVLNSRIELSKAVVDEANALTTKSEQLRFLLKILPPSESEEKTLSDKQSDAMFLLGSCGDPRIIPPLIDRIEFKHKRYGHPAIHALIRIGEPAIAPLVDKLQSPLDHETADSCVLAIRAIKGREFSKFSSQLLKDDKLKLTEQSKESLRLFILDDRRVK